MQAEIEAAFPDMKVNILAVNEVAQASGNSLATTGRDLPFLQDTDVNGDGQSDVWTSWDATWRDVYILDGNNKLVAKYNLTTNNLATTSNYDTLRDMLVDAAYSDQMPYCNWRNPLDVDRNSQVNAADVQFLFDTLNLEGPRQLAMPEQPNSVSKFYDVDQDGYAAPIDCLLILNYLNASDAAAAQGESCVPNAAASPSFPSGEAMLSDRTNNVEIGSSNVSAVSVAVVNADQTDSLVASNANLVSPNTRRFDDGLG